MRVRSVLSRAICTVLLAGLSGAGFGSAQTTGLVGGQIVGTTGLSTGSTFGPAGVKGQPYSLVETITTVQTLADGTTITNVTEQRRMRDSEGRERTESGVMKDGELKVRIIHLQDPVTRSMTTLMPFNKTAHTFRFPELKPPTPEQEARAAERLAKVEAYRKDHPAAPNNDDLAPQTVAGVYAEGKRHTMVIPVGQMGNDREITVVTETWTSPELKVVVGSTTDDPRLGKTTRVVTNLERGEPDATLFQIPPDYKVSEDNPVHVGQP